MWKCSFQVSALVKTYSKVVTKQYLKWQPNDITSLTKGSFSVHLCLVASTSACVTQNLGVERLNNLQNWCQEGSECYPSNDITVVTGSKEQEPGKASLAHLGDTDSGVSILGLSCFLEGNQKSLILGKIVIYKAGFLWFQDLKQKCQGLKVEFLL